MALGAGVAEFVEQAHLMGRLVLERAQVLEPPARAVRDGLRGHGG